MKVMSTDELRDILARLGWSQGELARRTRRERSSVQKLCRGRGEIDAELAAWLRRMAGVRAQISDEAWAGLRETLAERPPVPEQPLGRGGRELNVDLATGLEDSEQ